MYPNAVPATDTAPASQRLFRKACRSYQLSRTAPRFAKENCPSTINVIRKSRRTGYRTNTAREIQMAARAGRRAGSRLRGDTFSAAESADGRFMASFSLSEL